MLILIAMALVELILGMAAWAFGLTALFLCRKKDAVRMCGMGSLTCCAASLCVVVFGFAYMADIEAVSAFMDTANAFRFAARVMLTVTVALNASALIACRDDERK